MSQNSAQKAYCTYNAVTLESILNGTADAAKRLGYSNIDPTPDPVAASSYTLVQQEFLGPREVANLNAADRELFEELGVPLGGRKEESTPASKPFQLDPAKLSGKDSLHRLMVHESFEKIARAMANPNTVDASTLTNARVIVAPYLVS